MVKLLKILIWTLLVLAVLTGVDQVLLRVPLKQPGLTQIQQFYVDFRGRVLGLAAVAKTDRSIEQVIERNAAAKNSAKSKTHRYLYVDEQGALQFADSFDQVPLRFRKDAQPLAE